MTYNREKMPKKKTFHCYRYKITLNIFFIFLSLLVSSCWPYLLCRLRVIRRYFCNSNKQQQESRLWLYNFIRWMAFCDMNWAPFEFLNIFCLFFSPLIPHTCDHVESSIVTPGFRFEFFSSFCCCLFGLTEVADDFLCQPHLSFSLPPKSQLLPNDRPN